jgi:hypothetical protein
VQGKAAAHFQCGDCFGSGGTQFGGVCAGRMAERWFCEAASVTFKTCVGFETYV